MDDPMDDDLARAIALSLKEAEAVEGSQRSRVIDKQAPTIEEDDVYEDLDSQDMYEEEISKALAASMQNDSSSSTPQEAVQRSDHTKSFLSERAKLEQERIQRQKRQRGENSVDDVVPAAKRQNQTSSPPKPTPNPQLARAQPTPGQSNTTTESGQNLFWNGELRPIANLHSSPRRDNKPTFRFTDILGPKSELAFAILSSYALDLAWVYEFFDPNVPVIMVAQPDTSGRASVRNILPNWIKTTPPLPGGFGCQHMKFMLLFYKSGRLRVTISTANLISHDYRDIENAAWVQDIAKRSSPIQSDSTEQEDFPAMMQRVLLGVNVKPALEIMIKQDHPNVPLQKIQDLRGNWDWSKVKVHLVPSIAGRHEGWNNVIFSGHTRLMKVVRNMGLATSGTKNKKLRLECQGSSIAAYTTQWMNEFYQSAQGNDAEDWLNRTKRSREKLPYPPVKILFPTKKRVLETVYGEPGGGTMFCRRAQWKAANFPRELFHNSISMGGPVLMHTKMILALREEKSKIFDKKGKEVIVIDSDTEDDDDDVEVINEALGWGYVGSHNFTQSAWGNLSGSGFNPVLNIRNYELGIVFPLQTQREIENFVCWQRPPPKYGSDEPWIQEESPHFMHVT